MTFIADLEPYDYYPGAPQALAVGWLDSGEPFTAGACPQDVRDRLEGLSREPVHLTRGYHYCQFCMTTAGPGLLLRADINLYEDPDVARGNGEIWLTSPSGTNFAAPALIAHYIDAHSYIPPGVFIEAVRFGDPTADLT